MVFCNNKLQLLHCQVFIVTILILIDGFLQYKLRGIKMLWNESHNPYFNRWFSAITYNVDLNTLADCHNPYFNRWFSAIVYRKNYYGNEDMSQSLF